MVPDEGEVNTEQANDIDAVKAAAKLKAANEVANEGEGTSDMQRFDEEKARMTPPTPERCPACHGRGMIGGTICSECNATGVAA